MMQNGCNRQDTALITVSLFPAYYSSRSPPPGAVHCERPTGHDPHPSGTPPVRDHAGQEIYTATLLRETPMKRNDQFLIPWKDMQSCRAIRIYIRKSNESKNSTFAHRLTNTREMNIKKSRIGPQRESLFLHLESFYLPFIRCTKS